MFETMGFGGDALDRLLENGGSVASSIAIVGTRHTLVGTIAMED
jgi:hypothetical protein